MGSYKIILKPSVEKDLRSLPQSLVMRIFRQIETLQDDPLPRGARKLSTTEELYRVRVGDYRIVYAIDKGGKRVIVYYVRHRRDVYRQL